MMLAMAHLLDFVAALMVLCRQKRQAEVSST